MAGPGQGGMARPRPIGRDEVQQLVAAGAQLVDVMPREEYDESHLPGARHIPLKELDAERARALDPSKPVVVYCYDYQ